MIPLTGKTNDFLRVVLPACASGKLDAVTTYLLDERDFVRWIGPHGRTMVWEAARRGRLEVVRLLVEEHDADPRAIGCYYREAGIEISPWLVATLNRKSSTADYLTSRDAGLDFHSACYLDDRAFVEEEIRTNETALNTPYVREHTWNGYTVWPLQYAVMGGHTGMVELMLAAGADPRMSPAILFDAVNTEQLEIARLLLDAGADPVATQHRGWFEDPRFNALARGFGHAIGATDVPPEKWPELVDVCRGNHNAPDDPARPAKLLGCGADVNVRDYKGKTALHRASQAGFLRITDLLLEHGANLEARSHKGETPLFDAAFYGKADQIALLVEHGADLEARDDAEETPVFAAVRGGQADAVRLLHALGASLDAINAKGKSLHDIAQRSRKIGIEEVRRALAELDPETGS